MKGFDIKLTTFMSFFFKVLVAFRSVLFVFQVEKLRRWGWGQIVKF